VEAAGLSNFVGYIAWCLWLIALAVVLWRGPRDRRHGSTTAETIAASRVRRG
jgi:hypothetical protein